MKKIVIVGAGYSGILTAKKLAKKFKNKNEVSITIIDKNPFHTMLTELHEVAANRVDEDSIKISLKKIFAGRNVTIELDTATSIDFEKKTVIGVSKSYPYDYLVLAAGSKPSFFNTPGAKEYAFHLWSYDDAVKLKDQIHTSFRKAVCESNPEEKKRLLSFYIIGAGFTGAEMAAELAEYVPILCEKFEIDRSLVTIFNVDVLSRMVPVLPETLSAKIERRVTKMGITVLLNTNVIAVGENFIELKEKERTVRSPAGTIVWVAGIESNDITGQASTKLAFKGRGRIVVDEYLRSIENDSVYVVGDNMFYIAPGDTTPVPQMVENCEQSADTAAHNIACAISGTDLMKAYKPSFHGVMVSAGGRYGVARVGTAKHMVNLPSFFAMFVKHFINIIYFIQVLGWNKVFGYLKHEFFTIRNKRSFVGGHFSNRTPSFLLVPLRVWLGAVWLFEGIKKITEGWFGAPKLTDFFGGATTWFNSILGSASNSADATSSATGVAAKVTDAVSGATGAAAETASAVGKAILNFDFLHLFRIIFVSGKAIAQSTINDYAFKLDIPLMNKFVYSVILSNDGVQLFMQTFIVLAEIIIGLSLIGGLFTTPSSALSLVLLFMFVCTTGLYLNTFWMIFAGIALLIASGSIFGLDYYAIPALKKGWKKLPIVRRLYIYND